MARIKGNKLTIEFDGEAYTDHVKSLKLEQAASDSKFVTFADAAAGGSYEWTMTGSAAQDTDASSFWTMVWDSTGTEVPFTVALHGNATPSVLEPHYEGTVKIGVKPAIGGDAGEDVFEFDFEWKVVGDVTKVTA